MHQHDWQPIPGAMGRYLCADPACGRTGYRGHLGIVPHRNQLPVRAPTTRRPATWNGGHVERAPTLDEYDRRSR